ncbi:hypothetical protein [Kineobactrum salinum]|uniref:Uncharacterized protein n=1 Tax=Kineobactrum salinum TaxID=2708301 RepID=A0A6C0U267_9GAMM|nr:hypothetical protein [Kineobactrum salinum]QIB66018.1 hypothetical protein G3T16_11925 [Kineobactrum salinum]
MPARALAVCFVGLLLPLVAAAASSSGQAAVLSRFDRAALALQQASPEARTNFARVALLQLVEIYLAEADLARSEARGQAPDSRLRGWSLAVDRYARQLLLVHEDVAAGVPVSVLAHPAGDIAISAAGRPVIVSHPRQDQQPALEQAILADFCAVEDCQLLLAGQQADREPVPLSAASGARHWTFSEAGPRCSRRGLSVQFAASGELPRQRMLCRQLFAELDALVAELRWQRRHGVRPDWAALSLSAIPNQPRHMLRLNDAGDSLLLSLPLLHGTPGLLTSLQGWLHANSEGAPVPALLLSATELGWEAAGAVYSTSPDP